MDKKLIDTLSNFSEALGKLVVELSEQSKKKSKQKPMSDIFTSGSINKQIKKMNEGILKIKSDTKEIIKNQKELLRLSRTNRQQQETGLFDKAGDKGSIDKITSGVGSIILIAGAVLAIGTAFGMIGKIDPINVLALAGAMSLMGITIAKLSEYGIPDTNQAMAIGLALLAFTGAVVISSHLINQMADIDDSKILPFIVISAAYSLLLASGVLSSVSSIDYEDVGKLVLVMPSLALAVMLSSHVINKMSPLKSDILTSFTLTSLSLSLAVLAMMPSLYIMSKMGAQLPVAAGIAVLTLPLLTLGIALSSYMIGSINQIDEATLLNMVVIAGTLSLASLAMLPVLYLMNMMGPKIILAATIGLITLPLIATSLMISSHILAMGNYENPIPLGWALSFSIAMLILAIPVAILGAIPLPMVLSGAVALIAVSGALLISSHILSGIDTTFLMKMADVIAYFVEVVGGAVMNFAGKYLNVLVEIASALFNKVLPPLKDFITGVLPALGEFFKTILQEFFPYIREIFSFLKGMAAVAADVISSIGDIIEKAGGVFLKIGTMFESIGTAIATPINAVTGLIEKFGDTFERIINSTVNGIQMLSNMDPQKIRNISDSLSLLGKSMGALTGGLDDTVLQLFTGGKQDPLTRVLSSIAQYGPSVDGVGESVYNLAKGIKELDSIDVDSAKIENIANILDRIGNSSSNINVTSEQIINAKNLVAELTKNQTPDKSEELISKLDVIIGQLSSISGSSSSISSQLETMRLQLESEPSIEL